MRLRKEIKWNDMSHKLSVINLLITGALLTVFTGGLITSITILIIN